MTSMTGKLRSHLILCEQAMQAAKPILSMHEYPTDNRTLTVIGFVSMLIEYQESILLLVMNDHAGAASALFRPVVESAYRGLWINLPASDAEVTTFTQKDEVKPTFGELAKKLDDAYGTLDFFQDFKTRAWKHLNSYTHGGMHQVSRRFDKGEVKNNYSDQEVYEMTTSVTTIALLAISLFLKRHGHTELGDQVQSLLNTYGPAV